ncbi:MAG: hypothetical protein DDG59_13885 [Anaerolineae bacterium]|nr:MAG: hypothetical protein DDG59_13885 [Anaerolineae bacterium]
MKFPHLLSWLILPCMVLTTACIPSAVTTPSGGEPPQAQLPPATAPLSNPAVETARQALAQKLGVAAEQLEVFAVETRQFPNRCLGLPQEGEACAEAIVSGYQGVILEEGMQYEFRVNEDGTILRFLPGAALSAQQMLASQLGIPPQDVLILGYENVDWPDACLGIPTTGLLCAQVITPGFRVLLEAQGKRYVFHTNLSGSDVRLAFQPNLEGGQTLLEWQGEDSGICQTLLLSEEALSYGICEQPLTSVPLVGRGLRQDLERFMQTYAPFEAQTEAGLIRFQGRGAVTATPAEQRMIAEWARQQWVETEPQATPSSSVAIALHREGGLSGLCEDLLIYRSGIAEISSCLPTRQLGVQKVYLTAAQMQELFRWFDSLLPFESSEGDSQIPDGLSLRLVFNGKGQQQADAAVRQQMAQFAQAIADQAAQIQDQTVLEAAKQALLEYLNALKAADYQAVVKRYGGSYDVLADMNPDLSPQDTLALWTRACQQNGFVCNLTVKHWVHAAQLSADQIRLTVELQNPDGTLFVLGPCCGAEVQDFPPLTQFDFIVQRSGAHYLVLSLPVFVP